MATPNPQNVTTKIQYATAKAEEGLMLLNQAHREKELNVCTNGDFKRAVRKLKLVTDAITEASDYNLLYSIIERK